MSTLRISNIEAKSVPASATIDEKIKITNSSGDPLVFIDGKTSGITTVGINTTDSNITFDANSNVVVTGIITATRFSGQITPTSLEIGSNIKLGNAGVITATSFVGSGANLTNLPAQATIANNADNRIITGGSGVNLNGEANLTFNGTTLDLNGTANILKSDSSGFHVLIRNTNNTNGNQAELRFQGTNSSNGGYTTARIIATNLDNYNQYSDLRFFTHSLGSTTEKLRIKSNGDVGIGTASPQAGGLTVLRHSEARLQVWANGDGSNGKIALRADGTNTQMGTWSNHDCHLVRNEVIQATISSTGISLPAGKGIDFSATSDATGVTSELFDDYERGVHVISVLGSNSNPSVNLSANHKRLYYTKIGSMVHVTGELRWTINSHGSGDLRITLPFQSDSSVSCNSQGTAQTWNVNWAWRSETRDIWSEVSPGHSYMRFRLGGSGSLHEDYLQLGSTYQKTANSGYGVEYQVSLWYRTG